MASTLKSLPEILSHHRIRTLLVVLAEVLTIFEWCLSPTDSLIAQIFTVLHLLAVLSIAVFPRGGSIAVVVLHLIWMWTDASQSGPAQLWGVWVAIGIATYTGLTQFMCAATALIICSEYITRTLMHHQEWLGSLTIGITYATALVAGLLYREHVAREQESKRVALARMHSLMAQRIHDSVAGDLSYATLRLRANAANPNFSASAQQEFSDAADILAHAMNSVRDAINLFSDSKIAEHPSEDMNSYIRDVLLRSQQRLQELGFHGEAHLSGDISNLTDEQLAIVRTAIEEITANLIRHSQRAEYMLEITADDNCVRLLSSNLVETTNQHHGLPTFGLGLQFLRKSVEHVHGTLRTNSEDGEWLIVITLPQSQQQELSSKSPMKS